VDTSAVLLKKLLDEGSIDLWAKLKLTFLDSAYSAVYSAISRHYIKYNKLPTFEDLEVSLREGATSKLVAALRLVDASEIDSHVALDALIDQYTQNEAIKLLDRFVDKLPLYDTQEIKDNLANIVLSLDEKTLTTEGVFTMSDIILFQPDDELNRNKVYLGINNMFDAALAGVSRQELILIGGRRGSGKSIASNNLMVNQYESGNSSLYFSIEMTGYETFQRTMSILADVDHQNLKQNKLTSDELLRVVKARASMFEGAEGLVEDFLATQDRFKFEQALIRDCKLKPDNQMIIIDDRALTLSSVDLHIGKAKAKFGDKLTTVIIDYLNQIVIDGGFSQFDWQPQVIISKKLKELARKYDVVMVSPYQIDATGEARFAKGILDAADIALTMEAHEKELGALTFSTSKIRGGREMKFTSPINWDTLRISPVSMETPQKTEKIKKAGNKQKTEEEVVDLPWDN
jgi:replicative DNA helicase